MEEQEEGVEYQREVDGVMKTFVTVDGVEYEVIPVIKIDTETGDPILDENGNFVEDDSHLTYQRAEPEFTDSSPPIRDE